MTGLDRQVGMTAMDSCRWASLSTLRRTVAFDGGDLCRMSWRNRLVSGLGPKVGLSGTARP
jgi:hypothetical protein